MSKSADAFRTISEVAEWLGVQTHVLRFWESKFSQVRPVKRAGGRRYYRPADMLLLGGIRKLLHDDGLTIKGVQKVLREQGIGHVAGLSAPLDALTSAQIDGEDMPVEATAAHEATVAALDPAPEQPSLPYGDLPETAEAAPEPEVPVESELADDADAPDMEGVQADDSTAPVMPPAFEDTAPDTDVPDVSLEEPEAPAEDIATATVEPVVEDVPSAEIEATDEAAIGADDAAQEDAAAVDLPETQEDAPAAPVFEHAEVVAENSALAEDVAPDDDMVETTAEPDIAEAAPTPAIVEAPDGPEPAEIEVTPGLLSGLVAQKALSAEQSANAAPLLAQLTALRDRMRAAG